MTKTWFPPVLAAAVAILIPSYALSADFDSVFISYNQDNCISPATNNFDAEFYCIGQNNIPYYIATADAERQAFVSYGENSKNEQAASQSLPQVTSVEPDVEWRITNETGDWQAFAAIQKWYTTNEWDTPGETLVVTKVEKGSTCHIAYIDAVVTPRPHNRARKIADLCTHKFRCATDKPMVISGPFPEKDKRICTHTWDGFFWK